MISRQAVLIIACVFLAFVAVATVATAQTITSIDPNVGVRGTTVHATVQGTGFSAGAQVLVYGGGTAVWATNEATTGTTGIACDLAIPANAYLGKYAVYVQNPGAYSWIYSANAFEVVATAPPSPAPVLIAPADGTVFSNNPHWASLHWKPVPGATGYAIDLAWSSNGGETWVQAPMTMISVGAVNCSYTVEIDRHSYWVSLWRWRVMPQGVTNPVSSDYWYFTFMSPRLPTPVLVSPPDGAVFYQYPYEVTLAWTPVPGVFRYQFQIEQLVDGRWTVVTSWHTGYDYAWRRSSYTFSPSNPLRFGPGTYRWHVMAYPDESDVHQSEWSPYRTFTFTDMEGSIL